MNYLKVFVFSVSAAISGLFGWNRTVPVAPVATTTLSATTTVATPIVKAKVTSKAVVEAPEPVPAAPTPVPVPTPVPIPPPITPPPVPTFYASGTNPNATTTLAVSDEDLVKQNIATKQQEIIALQGEIDGARRNQPTMNAGLVVLDQYNQLINDDTQKIAKLQEQIAELEANGLITQ